MVTPNERLTSSSPLPLFALVFACQSVCECRGARRVRAARDESASTRCLTLVRVSRTHQSQQRKTEESATHKRARVQSVQHKATPLISFSHHLSLALSLSSSHSDCRLSHRLSLHSLPLSPMQPLTRLLATHSGQTLAETEKRGKR